VLHEPDVLPACLATAFDLDPSPTYLGQGFGRQTFRTLAGCVNKEREHLRARRRAGGRAEVVVRLSAVALVAKADAARLVLRSDPSSAVALLRSVGATSQSSIGAARASDRCGPNPGSVTLKDRRVAPYA